MNSPIYNNQFGSSPRPSLPPNSPSYPIQQPNRYLQPSNPMHLKNNIPPHNLRPKTNFVTSQQQNVIHNSQPAHYQTINHNNLQQNYQRQNMARITEPRPPQSKVQYVPYQNYYIDYEEQQVMETVLVPVQRKCINYMKVEKVVDYIPKEHEQTITEMVPEEKVHMRLAYVPVQTKVIHYPKGDGTFGARIQQANLNVHARSHTNIDFGSKVDGSFNTSQIGRSRRTNRKLPRTNFVTSDNYVPSDFYEELVENERIETVENQNQSRFRESQKSRSNYGPTYQNYD